MSQYENNNEEGNDGGSKYFNPGSPESSASEHGAFFVTCSICHFIFLFQKTALMKN